MRAQFSDPVNIALGARSLDAFEAFPKRPGQRIDLHQVGYLFLLTDPSDLARHEMSVALQNDMGVHTRMLTPAQAAELARGVITRDVLAAAFHARGGYCSPESVVLGYATGARRHGAVIRTGVTVTDIESKDGEIVAVHTDAGLTSTNTVVCAAGAWSEAIGEMVGVALPVTPLRRQILVTESLTEQLSVLMPVTMPLTIDASSTLYLHREGPGVLVGMSHRGEQPGFRHDYSQEWLPQLVEALERRCPALLDTGIAHSWSGLYEVTPDHNALVGEAVNVRRFLYATGFSGHGFLQGPAVGEAIRDLCLRREPLVDVNPLSADRFKAGSIRTEHNII